LKAQTIKKARGLKLLTNHMVLSPSLNSRNSNVGLK